MWRELEAETGTELMLECGMAWFAHREDGWEAASERTLAAQGIPVERLDPADAAQRFPSLGTDDLTFVLWEPEAGVVRAQHACGRWRGRPPRTGHGVVRGRARPDGAHAVLDDGTRLEADTIVWACGGWLRDLFPEVVRLRVTCQELLFLDGGPAWPAPAVPGWVDYDRAMYGTGDVDGIGAKMALDLEGPPLDPDAPLPPGGEPSRACARTWPSVSRRSRTRRSKRAAAAATSCRPTRTSSPRRTPSTRACGCSAAAPATASSTAPRSPTA